MNNEQIWKSCKYIYTIFVSMLFGLIVILGFQNGFTLLTVLSSISMILYIVCLMYVAKNKRYVYLLSAGMLNALFFMFAEMLCNVFKQQGEVSSLVWFVAVIELGIIGITLFPGKYLYLHKIAKQKTVKKYDWGKNSLIILIFGIAVRWFFRKVSPMISNDQELIYSILLLLVIGIIFQIVNWMMIYKFVTEKRNSKGINT